MIELSIDSIKGRKAHWYIGGLESLLGVFRSSERMVNKKMCQHLIIIIVIELNSLLGQTKSSHVNYLVDSSEDDAFWSRAFIEFISDKDAVKSSINMNLYFTGDV